MRVDDVVAARKPTWGRAVAGLAALGATLGTAMDAVHVHTGTTSYPHPTLLGMAGWVPIVFAAAGIACGLGREMIDFLRHGPRAAPAFEPRRERLALGLLLFVATYALSGGLPGGMAVKMPVLGALALATWVACDGSAAGAVYAAAVAAAGFGVEGVLVRAGVFRHHDPGAFGVAAWIPFLYATAAIGIGNVGRRLVHGPRRGDRGAPQARG